MKNSEILFILEISWKIALVLAIVVEIKYYFYYLNFIHIFEIYTMKKGKRYIRKQVQWQTHINEFQTHKQTHSRRHMNTQSRRHTHIYIYACMYMYKTVTEADIKKLAVCIWAFVNNVSNLDRIMLTLKLFPDKWHVRLSMRLLWVFFPIINHIR